MKTLAPVALSVAFVGLHLSKPHQVDSFVFCGSARPSSQKMLSSRGSRGLRRGRTACRGIQCRMSGAINDEGRPTKGFAQPQESRKSTPKGKGKKKLAAEKAAAAADEKDEEKGTGNRQLFMQFTCNKCEGVSQYMINKNAYEDGIVICTCQSCHVRHLIADNLKKMDFPDFGNNIEEYMQSTGSPEEVTKGNAPDLTPEVVEKFDISVGADGVLTLSPKEGTQSP